KEVFCRVLKIIGGYFSPQNWSLLLMDENTGRLRFDISMGVDADRLKEVYIEKGEGIVGWVCEHGIPVLVEDVQNDRRFSPRVDQILGFTTHAVVCVPLINGKNRVVGAIELINKISPPSLKSVRGECTSWICPTCETFTETDMKILAAIGTFTGIAAENAFLYQKVEEMAQTDSLTGISNRLCFQEILACESEKARRCGHYICILMIDVDDFKNVNDNYGHLTGDRVLCDIARILRSSVRESDFVARFGGDEFVVLMPFAGESEGLRLAKRIQEMIREWNEKERIPGLKMEVSIGVHACGPENINNLLLEADREMYRCKTFRKKPGEIHFGDFH
ncbi:MAG: diguanylate cyclase, partial [Desulfococcaceae bacterium]